MPQLNRGAFLCTVLVFFAVGLGCALAEVGSEDGSWVWENPLPAGDEITDVWCNSDSEVYITTTAGAVLRSSDSGATWQRSLSSSYPMNSIWGASADDVFAVDDAGNIFHYKTGAWRDITPNNTVPFNAVFGSSGTNVYFAGDDGLIFRYYEGSVKKVYTHPLNDHPTAEPPDLNDIWVAPNGDVFAVGQKIGGVAAIGEPGEEDYVPEVPASVTIVRYNSSTEEWEEHTSAEVNNQPLYGVWGTSDSNVYAVGEAGTILHYDGGSWTQRVSDTPQNLLSISGIDENNIGIVGGSEIFLFSGDGVNWTKKDLGSRKLNGLWLTSSSTGYAVGSVGTGDATLRRLDGDWSDLNDWSYLNTSITGHDLQDVWTSGPDDGGEVYAVGRGGTVVHYGGSWGEFEQLELPDESKPVLYGVWGSSASDVFIVGSKASIFRGSSSGGWTQLTSLPPEVMTGDGSYGPVDLYDIWGSGPNDIFIVGEWITGETVEEDKFTILHSTNGTDWTLMSGPEGVEPVYLYGVWGNGPDDVYAVGDIGTILHYDGNDLGVWTQLTNLSGADL